MNMVNHRGIAKLRGLEFLIRPIPIMREQIPKLGKYTDSVAKLEDDAWSLGEDAYVAALDVFHNLHCLNTYVKISYAPKGDRAPSGHRGGQGG
ncbi:Uu.00g017820.m01.CDS01 [Anthostomella pinea]|uniref:Uu.00g017820.m01.CDS01 n=1 Tax=Anthostomella pinea TaxID=933095 RepID=A0AAI8W070_9PEZI|nr:Uu.00g017820.m01.CDS01 [Anthostomella pinea]